MTVSLAPNTKLNFGRHPIPFNFEILAKFPQGSPVCLIRNLIFFNQHGYGFFQKKNKYLTTEDMKEYFTNNFLNNMYLSENEIDDLVNNIDIHVEIISPIEKHNIYCSGNLIQDELK